MSDWLLLVRADLVKLCKHAQTWALLAMTLALLVLSFRGDVRKAQEPSAEQPDPFVMGPEAYREVVTLPGAFGQLPRNYHFPCVLALLLATLTVSQEFGWRTARTVLSREAGRGRLLLARLTAVGALSLFHLLVMWLVYGLLAWLAAATLGDTVDLIWLNGSFLAVQLGTIGRIWLVSLPLIAFGILIGVWVRNAAISITLGGMVYFLAWMVGLFVLGMLSLLLERVVQAGQDLTTVDLGFWGVVPSLLPHYNMAAAVHWHVTDMAQDPSLMMLHLPGVKLPHDPWRSLALLGGYGLVSFALAWWQFRRKDVL